jgi:hypothetical protein
VAGSGRRGNRAALWLRDKTLAIEQGRVLLSRYAVEFAAGTSKPRTVAHPVLFGAAIPLRQPRLFRLESLGEGDWGLSFRPALLGDPLLPQVHDGL